MDQQSCQFFDRCFTAAYNASIWEDRSSIGEDDQTLSVVDEFVDEKTLFILRELFPQIVSTFVVYHNLYTRQSTKFLQEKLGTGVKFFLNSKASRNEISLKDALYRYLKDQVHDILDKSELLLDVLNFKLESGSRKTWVYRLIILTLSDQIIPYLKYKTTWLMNYMIGSCPSDYPTVNSLFDSIPLICSKFYSKVMSWKNRKRVYIFSIFQGWKRCIPPVSPIRVFQAAVDHKMTLERTPEDPDPVFIRDLEEKIYEALYQPICDSLRELYVPSTVSINSSFQNTRSHGGVCTETIDLLFDKGYLPLSAFLGFGHELHEDSRGFVLKYVNVLSDEDLCDAWEAYYASEIPARCFAEPHLILEPFKVRTITKGDATSNAFLSSFQKFLFSILKKTESDPFVLTRENTEEAVTRNVSNLVGISDHLDGRWISVDYTSATDRLKRFISLTIFDTIQRICKVQFPDQYTILWRQFDQARKSLFGYRIRTTSKSIPFSSIGLEPEMNWEVEWDQTNGQLMGSVISFPVLCIANLLCHWVSVENTLCQKVSFSDLVLDFPVLINGDDMLFKSIDLEHEEHFKKVAEQFGFSPSLGKNFANHEFFTINSKLYRMEEDVPVYVPFINFGLLTGRHKGDNSAPVEEVYLSTRTKSDLRILTARSSFDLLVKDLKGTKESRLSSLGLRLQEGFLKYLEWDASPKVKELLRMTNDEIKRFIMNHPVKFLRKYDYETPYTRISGSAFANYLSRYGTILSAIQVHLGRNKCVESLRSTGYLSVSPFYIDIGLQKLIKDKKEILCIRPQSNLNLNSCKQELSNLLTILDH